MPKTTVKAFVEQLLKNIAQMGDCYGSEEFVNLVSNYLPTHHLAGYDQFDKDMDELEMELDDKSPKEWVPLTMKHLEDRCYFDDITL